MTRVLSERQRRLYSRQVILRELGEAGQAQLCATAVSAAVGGDAAASSIAFDYLTRAGLNVVDGALGQPLPVATSEQVAHTAGEPALRACAEWLHGAWAAVETIKHCAGLAEAEPTQLAPYPLTAEID